MTEVRIQHVDTPLYAHHARGRLPGPIHGSEKKLTGGAGRTAARAALPSNGLLYRMRHISPDATDAAPHTASDGVRHRQDRVICILL